MHEKKTIRSNGIIYPLKRIGTECVVIIGAQPSVIHAFALKFKEKLRLIRQRMQP